MTDVVDPNQGDFTVIQPIKELPYYIRSNCYQWLVYRLGPTVPPTRQILADLGSSGEIGVMVSNGIIHYVVVEIERENEFVISDTNWGSDTKKVRTVARTKFLGFYKL